MSGVLNPFCTGFFERLDAQIGGWDTGKVTTLFQTFEDADAFRLAEAAIGSATSATAGSAGLHSESEDVIVDDDPLCA